MTTTTIHLRPAEGLLVRDPATLAVLPPEGTLVELTSFWRARLAEGSVSEVQPPGRAAASGVAGQAARGGAQGVTKRGV